MTRREAAARPARTALLLTEQGPQSAALARHAATRLLSEWQLGEHVIEGGCVLVGELVADAWLHAGGAASVEVEAGADRLRVSVVGDPCWLPQPGHRGADAEFGGRLWLLSTLASRWGVVSATACKRVWAELDVEPDGSCPAPARGPTTPWVRLLEILLPQRGALANAQSAVEAHRREAQQRRDAALAMALAARRRPAETGRKDRAAEPPARVLAHLAPHGPQPVPVGGGRPAPARPDGRHHPAP